MKPQIFPRMHVSLYVSDLKQSVEFYNRFFGQAPSKVKPGYAKYELDSPSLIISFIEHPERVQEKFGHLGFQVDTQEELRIRQEAVQTAGLLPLEEKGTNCCFALQDKFWVTDPDGHEWEVYYFHADVEFNDPRYESVPACC